MTAEKLQDLPAEKFTGCADKKSAAETSEIGAPCEDEKTAADRDGKVAAGAVENMTGAGAVKEAVAPAAVNGALRMDGEITAGTAKKEAAPAAVNGAPHADGNLEKPENYNPIFYTAIAAMPKKLLSDRAFSVYQKLENDGVSYRAIFHPALFTADGVKAYVPVDEQTVVVKNLFLRNDTGTKMYLLVQCYDKHADLKALRAFLGSSRLGFCSEERLEKFLDVAAGSVSPLCIANDKEHRVQLILDADLQNYPVICMHPDDNTGSLYVSYADLLRFVKDSGHEPLFYRV